MRKYLSLLALIFVLSACRFYSIIKVTPTNFPIPTTVSNTPTATLNPYLPINQIEYPRLTQTPSYKSYQVKTGDTLSDVAFKNGLEVKDILAANPEIENNIILTGQTILLPPKNKGGVYLPQPTQIPVILSTPICFHPSIDGIWCSVTARHDFSYNLEEISIDFILYSANGQRITQQIVAAPLERMQTGKLMPVMAFFPSISGDVHSISVYVNSIIPGMLGTDRYIESQVEDIQSEIFQEGLKANISGNVKNISKDKPAKRIWIVAVGYDRNRNVNAMRKIEINNVLNPDQTIPFKFNIYSLGGEIIDIDVLVEAKP